MTSWQLFSLHTIAERTGAPIRSLRLWADAGAIRATPETNHSGRGNHRLFPGLELQIASLLTPLANFDLPIGQMVRLGEVFRRPAGLLPGHARGLHYQAGEPEIRRLLDRAAQGIGENWLAIVSASKDLWIEPLCEKDDRSVVRVLREFFPEGAGRRDAVIMMVDATVRLAGLFDDA